MALLKVVQDSLDDVDSSFHEYYTEKEGKFYLNLEGDIRKHPEGSKLQAVIDRRNSEKKTLTDKLAEVEAKLADLPEGFDAEKFAIDMDELEALRKKKTGEDPNDDEARQSQKRLYEQRIAKMEEKHGTEKTKLEAEKKDLEGHIQKLMGDEGLTKALVAAGVDKKLLPGATALLRRSVKVERVDGNGEWRAFVLTDQGEEEIDDFVSNWAQSDEGSVYIEKAKGGDSKGGNGQRLGENPWDTQGGKVKPNLTKQQEMIVANPERARALARAAGTPVTW